MIWHLKFYVISRCPLPFSIHPSTSDILSLDTAWILLNISWKGHLLDTAWTSLGNHLDTPWKPHGHSLDTPWKPPGHRRGYHLDTPWTPPCTPPEYFLDTP